MSHLTGKYFYWQIFYIFSDLTDLLILDDVILLLGAFGLWQLLIIASTSSLTYF